jgi:transcription antitermination factor NusA-like protein
VKTPLCNFCLKSGILCPKCQEKVRSGEIDDLDVKIAKVLLKLRDKYPSLEDITFYKAYRAKHVVATVVGHGDAPALLGHGGRIVRDLGDEVGAVIRVVEKGGGRRKFLEDLFAPVNIMTINTIWLPDGTTETRVILSGYPRRLPADIEALKSLARQIQDVTVRVEFEKT